ncbi:winged helix-turn-helix transcriptional regulator [Polyangium fumosum]|uniref:Transcriptional regulator n=1 Tax=Polyangium fumosum TaxID=889272 RepID=A0A4U1ISI3_9BACT|nr:helix-turn-helix domain-containing protein [Polyangium fumosum]TKC97220.1 transcriptional regulator [Polyangium fumosum]
MTRTDKKVRYSPESKSPAHQAAHDTTEALQILEGRWKMVIIFHLFVQPVMRFSELERAIPEVSQKMLIQQLRDLEADGVVARTVYPEVPPKVEYSLTVRGKALCPALDASLKWASSPDAPKRNDGPVLPSP